VCCHLAGSISLSLRVLPRLDCFTLSSRRSPAIGDSPRSADRLYLLKQSSVRASKHGACVGKNSDDLFTALLQNVPPHFDGISRLPVLFSIPFRGRNRNGGRINVNVEMLPLLEYHYSAINTIADDTCYASTFTLNVTGLLM